MAVLYLPLFAEQRRDGNFGKMQVGVVMVLGQGEGRS